MARRGRQFFQNPGPTNIPDEVLDAMRRPAVDYRGAAFARVLSDCIDGLSALLGTEQALVISAGSGHGAWEAALVNVFSAGDKVLSVSAGYFASGWAKYATNFGLDVVSLGGDWRTGVDPDAVEQRLREDTDRKIKGILVTHCETSTGVMTDCAAIRRALARADHPALLLVDVISSLACAEVRMDEWSIDIAVGASQKGLMLPTGLCFTGISAKALQTAASAGLPRAYWDWKRLLDGDRQVNFSGTGPVHMFYGLQAALRMIHEEGLDHVVARHDRLARAARSAVRNWAAAGVVETFAAEACAAPSLTAILLSGEPLADKVRTSALQDYNVQLAAGLDRLRGKVFRIAHMGDMNEAMLLGALACTEMAIHNTGVPCGAGGVEAAMVSLSGKPAPQPLPAQ